jgi:acyl-CoA reductase-like NAD-dependent aldehyde dehydrogenase
LFPNKTIQTPSQSPTDPFREGPSRGLLAYVDSEPRRTGAQEPKHRRAYCLVDTTKGPCIHSVNPTTGELVATYEEASTHVVGSQIETAQRLQLEWKQTTVAHRRDRLLRLATILGERNDDLASLMATEMGKPVTQGRAEVEKCA